MGYTNNGKFHVEWYDYLQNGFSPLKIYPNRDKRVLQLWPRGHAKTECTSINYLSWLIGNYPDIHVNIVTKTASLSEDIATALMTRFESHERYIEIFGELKPKDPKKWTSNKLIVKRHEISKNPTLKATGLMGAITGGRSDLIICDDIIDQENVSTQLQIEKAQTWFNNVLLPTLYPWGGIIVIGTRWHYADLYKTLLDQPQWQRSIKKAIVTDEKGNDTTQILWPEYWTLQKLIDRRKEIGTLSFNCQYQNDPTGMEGTLLKASWLQPWETEPPSNLPKYAGVDPSLCEGDFFAISTFSFDRATRQGYLNDVWTENASFPLAIQKLKQLHVQNRYMKIFVEANAFQKILAFLPDLQGLPIVPVHTATGKEERLIPLSSHFEAKRILVNPVTITPRNEFYRQWVQFPRGEHDDALDCVEIATRGLMPAGRSRWEAEVF
jgi:predicted phage terminase large subunit-like protein